MPKGISCCNQILWVAENMIYSILTKNAKRLIQNNKTFLLEDKVKNVQFLKLVQTNQPASLGSHDQKRVKRLKKFASKIQKNVLKCS